MNSHAGRSFGRYRLDESVGRGGMAEVYRAWDEKLERQVAVKLILETFAGDEHFQERFLREARLVAGLEHPHILPIYDFGDEEGQPYLVMPYLDQGTLADRLNGQPLPRLQVGGYVRQLADALDHAHRAGILHRDVKPANVLIGGDGRLVLGDFGIARMVDSSTHLTLTGVMVGTPVYMAPELARGDGAAPASDQYALACLAFELLVGQPPFGGENALSLLHQHINEPVPSLSARAPELPAALDAVLARGLAKAPEERHSSCGALAQALLGGDETLVTAPVSASGATTTLESPVREPSVEGGPTARSPLGKRSLLATAVVLLTALSAWTLITRRSGGGEVGDSELGAADAVASLELGEATSTPSGTAVPPPEGEALEEEAAFEGEPGGPEAAETPSPAAVATSHPPERPQPTEEEPEGTELPPASGQGTGPGVEERIGPETRQAWSRLLEKVEKLWLRGRIDRDHWQALAAEAGRLEALNDQGGTTLLLAYIQGGLAYADGDAAQARERLDGLLSPPGRLMAQVAALPVRYLRPGAELEAWQLALIYGDPLRQTEALLEAAEARDPGRTALTLGRALLAHLDGEHSQAAELAREAVAQLGSVEVGRAEMETLVGDELLHAGELGAAVAVYRALSEDPARSRRTVRTLELWGGRRAVIEACAAGYRPACLRGRRRAGGRG